MEEGPQRSNSPAGERPKNDGVCSFWKKGTCKKGKDYKFKHPKSPAPAEKGSESETGSEKKKKKKKAKAAPVISTGSLWEDSESEAESTPSEEEIANSNDAETECAPATPRAKLYHPKKGGMKTKSVVFRDWVEYDDGDVTNQVADFHQGTHFQRTHTMEIRGGL